MPSSGRKKTVFFVAGVAILIVIIASIAIAVYEVEKAKKESRDSDSANGERARKEIAQKNSIFTEMQEATRKKAEIAAAERERNEQNASDRFIDINSQRAVDDLKKRQQMLDSVRGTIKRVDEETQQLEDLQAQIKATTDFIKNCPSFVCNVRPEDDGEAFVIERWENNTASSFFGQAVSAISNTNDLISQVNLDFNTSASREVGRYDAPFSAAGFANPFLYRVQKTLFGSATFDISISLLIQMFDLSQSLQGNVDVTISAEAYTPAADGRLLPKTNFFVVGNSSGSLVSKLSQGTSSQTAVTNRVSIKKFTAPFASTYLSKSMSITVQNRRTMVDSEVFLNAGDVIRFTFNGIASAIFVAGEVTLGRNAFKLTPEAENEDTLNDRITKCRSEAENQQID